MKHSGAPFESVVSGLFKYSALMGIFPLPLPHVSSVNMILAKSDPWVIPALDLVDALGDVMLLGPAEVNYVEIVLAANFASLDSHISKTSFDRYSQSPLLGALESFDPLAETFLSNEGIMEIMPLEEPPWIDTHHHSLFLPRPMVISTVFKEYASPLLIDVSVHPDIIKIFQLRTPLSLHGFRIFYPPRVFTDCSLSRNPPSPRGHGGKASYEFHSIIWPSRCLLVMTTIKL